VPDKKQMLRSRNRIKQRMAAKYITPAVRRKRIEAAMVAAGYVSKNALATTCGFYWTQLENTMNRKDVSIRGLMRVAIALGVSLDYLTLKKIQVTKTREGDHDR